MLKMRVQRCEHDHIFLPSTKHADNFIRRDALHTAEMPTSEYWYYVDQNHTLARGNAVDCCLEDCFAFIVCARPSLLRRNPFHLTSKRPFCPVDSNQRYCSAFHHQEVIVQETARG
ncbi:hypothetical protein PsorP6_015222 [Peronosclerospora sorghi]|uniref:Uncharacterized protein n=1 Tax=Peronosclerospora sorghi TaxID=230839 RepID=A0ACC0VSG1_9STRA|nr:hypothetical protein PsorP6_015222 [Peronosclerospora sorghi]